MRAGFNFSVPLRERIPSGKNSSIEYNFNEENNRDPPLDIMEVDLTEIDRTLEELPVDPVKRKQRSESQDSTVEDDVAIAEAITAVEKELDEVEGKKEEGSLLTPSALLMTAVVVGSIISAKLLPLFFPK